MSKFFLKHSVLQFLTAEKTNKTCSVLHTLLAFLYNCYCTVLL